MNTQKQVGICACYGTRNYGSMLQAFATQEAVRKLGYTAEFIRYKKKKTIQVFFFLYVSRQETRKLVSLSLGRFVNGRDGECVNQI